MSAPALDRGAGKVLCWHCNKALVGKGGSWKARPLYFAEVQLAPRQKVKVHKCCERDAKETLRYLTAQPTSAAQMDAQIDDMLGHE